MIVSVPFDLGFSLEWPFLSACTVVHVHARTFTHTVHPSNFLCFRKLDRKSHRGLLHKTNQLYCFRVMTKGGVVLRYRNEVNQSVCLHAH